MLERLEILHGTGEQYSEDELRTEFFSYKYDESKIIIENCLKINGLAQALRAVGKEVKDELLITRISNCLLEIVQTFPFRLGSYSRYLQNDLQSPATSKTGRSTQNTVLRKRKFKSKNKNFKKGQVKSKCCLINCYKNIRERLQICFLFAQFSIG